MAKPQQTEVREPVIVPLRRGHPAQQITLCRWILGGGSQQVVQDAHVGCSCCSYSRDVSVGQPGRGMDRRG